MAYKRSLAIPECNWTICGRRAEYAVYNNQNAFVGDYCAKHAEARVHEINKKEQAS